MSTSQEYRIERDSIGTREVPTDAYYGVQSLRARENFHITGMPMHRELIRSAAQIKKAAALCAGHPAGHGGAVVAETIGFALQHLPARHRLAVGVQIAPLPVCHLPTGGGRSWPASGAAQQHQTKKNTQWPNQVFHGTLPQQMNL